MTLLRRAPREVYRVYTEDEFLADATCEELFPTSGRAVSSRRLRFAGTTLLLAAAGAVGGLVVLTSMQPLSGGRRRERPRPVMTSGLLASVRAQHLNVRRQRGAAGVDGPGRGSVSRHIARRQSRASVVRARKHRHDVAAPSELARVRTSAPVTQRPAVEVVANVGAQPTVAAAVGEPGQAEFGFER
jgi:hypothetical protein